MSKSPEKVSFDDCKIIKATDKAVLIRFPDREEPVWIPQSQIHEDSEIWIEGHEGKLVITEWFCIKNNLI